MREILFRGKRQDNGEWVEGFFAQSGEMTYILIDNDFAVGYVKMKEVVPKTVGQYTGLTDKNGKKIFEGDIVRYRPEYWSEPHWSVVEYCADKWNYPAFDLKDHDYESNGLQSAHEEGVELEVIGNIHDNPELLEVEE